MYDSLRDFFVECVLADHDAYIESREIKEAGLRIDLRLAIHTCSSMFHLVDHIFAQFKEDDKNSKFGSLKNYQSHLTMQCPDFEIIRDCANAHKHYEIDRHAPLIKSVKQLSEVLAMTTYYDDKGKYCIAEKEIHACLSDGTIKILGDCLQKC
jgi:hypothetical protein